MDESYNSSGEICYNDTNVADISITHQFAKLRLSALTKAAKISPLVREVTIGPKSPLKKELNYNNIQKDDVDGNKKVAEENDTEDKFRDDLRFTLVRKEFQNKINESSEELFKNLVEKMIAKRADTIRSYWQKQTEECERKALELKARKLKLLKDLQENDNLTMLQKAKVDQEKNQIINKQTIENMNKILEEQNKATARFAAITDSHTRICICYNDIANVLQTEPHAKEIRKKYIDSINNVMGNIAVIMEYCKSGCITDKEVKLASVITQNIENIRLKIIEDLNSLKEEEIKSKQLQEEQKEKELEKNKKQDEEKSAQMVQQQIIPKEKSKKGKPLFYSSANYHNYVNLQKFLHNYEMQYKDLIENVNLKKFRFDCQKAVNTPVNALSSVSGMHMRDKFDKLSKLLKGERVQVLDSYVMATQHPQGLQYCSALLAKKIVRQGDLMVSSKPEAAFPLAAIAVALWVQFPDFGKLLEAYFYKFCPYLVPMFLPQKEGQSDKEFYLSRGYNYNDDGVVEKQDKFLKRMSGIFRLYCAILIAKTPTFINQPNPHGLQYGWRWLASFVNLRPEPDICATLLYDFFSVCGSEFIKHYRCQFTKIIKLISTDYLAILQNIDEGGPKSRLEVFLQNVLKIGSIDPPNGILPPNVW